MSRSLQLHCVGALAARYFALLLFGVALHAHGSVSSPDADRVQAVQELARTLAAKHANAFHSISESEFNAAVARLRQRAPGLSDAEFMTELTRLVASIGDGHTFIDWTGCRALPFRFSIFADGVFVTAASTEHEALVGARVVGFGEASAGDALAQILPLVSADNVHQRAARAPIYLSIVDFLEGLGLTEPGRVRLRLRKPDGRAASVEIAPISFEEHLHGLDIVPAELQQFLAANFSNALSFGDMRPQADEGPLYRRRHAEPYWMQALERQQALYVHYRYVREGSPPVVEFAADLVRAARQRPTWRVVVDVRENPGGSSELSHPLAEALHRLDLERRPGWLAVIISPKTFSAATGFLSRLELRTSAILVGTATGAGANHFGNVRSYDVDGLDAQLKLSSTFHTWGLSGDRRTGTDPHVHVTERSSDYFAGTDVVLAKALEVTADDAGWTKAAPAAGLDRAYVHAPGKVLRVRCDASRCRVSITGVLDTPARAVAERSWVGWYRGLRVDGVSEESARLVAAGVDRVLPRAQSLPFEELAFRGSFEAVGPRLAEEFKADPENARFSPPVLNGLGYDALWQGHVQGAIAIFRAAIDIHPSTANLHDSLGEAELASGDRRAARSSYRKALSLDPKLESARRALERLGGSRE